MYDTSTNACMYVDDKAAAAAVCYYVYECASKVDLFII